MAKKEIKFPQMGESVVEGKITKWLKSPGDTVEKDETILEISTDKVDSEVPSSAAGVLVEVKVSEGEMAQVGDVIAIIETDASAAEVVDTPAEKPAAAPSSNGASPSSGGMDVVTPAAPTSLPAASGTSTTDSKGRFLSPLVRSIATKEGISTEELSTISGSGA